MGPFAWLCYCPINPEQLSEEQQQGSPAGLEHKKPSHILNKVESEPCAGRLAGQMQAELCRYFLKYISGKHKTSEGKYMEMDRMAENQQQ